MKFGYFVSDGYQDTISSNLKKLFPNDAKSNKALFLKTGACKIKVVSKDRAFNFADLQPVQILRVVKIIYLNRIGQESAFLTQQIHLILEINTLFEGQSILSDFSYP